VSGSVTPVPWRSWRTTTSTSGSCASRASPSGCRGSSSCPGKLDVADELPLETAKRELAEEIGKVAEQWRELTWFWSSPGFSDEGIHVFLATGLSDAEGEHEAEENERIEIVRWPLARLDELIAECRDGKSLVGLLWLRSLV